MGNKYILQKLIEWLNKLSDSDLEELSFLFSDPHVRTNLQAIINNALELRRVETKHKLQSGVRDLPSELPKMGFGNVMRNDTMSSIDQSPELKKVFFGLFNDSTLFPLRRDMLDAINSAFSCGLKYKQHEKTSRADLIVKCWNKFKELPIDEQRNKLKTLVSKISKNKVDSDDYKELFRLLVNHD